MLCVWWAGEVWEGIGIRRVVGSLESAVGFNYRLKLQRVQIRGLSVGDLWKSAASGPNMQSLGTPLLLSDNLSAEPGTYALVTLNINTQASQHLHTHQPKLMPCPGNANDSLLISSSPPFFLSCLPTPFCLYSHHPFISYISSLCVFVMVCVCKSACGSSLPAAQCVIEHELHDGQTKISSPHPYAGNDSSPRTPVETHTKRGDILKCYSKRAPSYPLYKVIWSYAPQGNTLINSCTCTQTCPSLFPTHFTQTHT